MYCSDSIVKDSYSTQHFTFSLYTSIEIVLVLDISLNQTSETTIGISLDHDRISFRHYIIPIFIIVGFEGAWS